MFRRLGLLAVGSIAILAMGWFLLSTIREPARCPEGLQAAGARCCGLGQTLSHGRCIGTATGCAPGMIRTQHLGEQHCQAVHRKITISGGRLTLGAIDWQAEGLVSPQAVDVAGFALDSVELTWGRYLECVAQGRCSPIVPQPTPPAEPGLPITDVTPQQASQLCLALGGRLPTGNEWLLASAGNSGRRYPWGDTGLVCRRAAFGLVNGPCAEGATLPELAGARPDGATAQGVHDMAGNVAEWSAENHGFLARGGSFRSRAASELKSWASFNSLHATADIGLRCAYDLD